MNRLDPRNYRNKLAGTTRTPGGTKNGLTKPAPWFTSPKGKLATDVGRLGLVYRSMEDGKNLIERSNQVIESIEALS